MSTSETNHRPPPGRVTNPEAIKEARRRGWPATPQAFADAASLSGVQLFVPATQAAVADGILELDAMDRDRARRAHDAAFTETVRREMENRQ